MNQRTYLLRLTVALLILVSLVGPLASVPRVAAQNAAIDIDLAAITLTTADLDDAGLERYGVGGSQMRNADRFAANRFRTDGYPYAETMDLLDATGFIRSHQVRMFSPRDDESLRQVVISNATLFEEAAGARKAFQVLEDESDEVSTQDLDGFDDFGDLSEATYSIEGDYHQITASALVDNLIIEVSILDWLDHEIDEVLLAELLESAINRIQDGLDAEVPALSNMVLRFGDAIETSTDYYAWRDGAMNRRYSDGEDDLEGHIEQHGAVGAIEQYQIVAGMVDYRSDSDDPAIFQHVRLYRFEDKESAEAWFNGWPDAPAQANSMESFESEPSQLGDNARFFEAVGRGSVRTAYSLAVVQVGKIGVEFGFGGPISTRDALKSIAEEQVECIEEGGCFDFIPLTDELLNAIQMTSGDDASANENAEPTEEPTADNASDKPADDPASGDGALETYTGQAYPFSVSFDPRIWTVEDASVITGSGDEMVRLRDEEGVDIYLIASQSFSPDDLEGCLFDAFTAYGWWMVGFTADQAENLQVNSDSASFTFPATTIGGTTAALTGECRVLEPDSVLTIFTLLPTDEIGTYPEEAIARAQVVIDTIQIGD